MMNKLKEIRWKQRFENLKRSFRLLEEAANIQDPSDSEKGGMIHFFETTFELSWKTLKDFLESEGFIVNTPREVFKQSFQIDVIKDGTEWFNALEDRNKTTHLYDEVQVDKIALKIKNYYLPLFIELVEFFNNKEKQKIELTKKELDIIKSGFRKYSNIKKVIIFGSRAMGNAKKGSDIDIALSGVNIDDKIINKINIELNEETNLPYKFDIIDYGSIKNQNLREHIDKKGQVIISIL